MLRGSLFAVLRRHAAASSATRTAASIRCANCRRISTPSSRPFATPSRTLRRTASAAQLPADRRHHPRAAGSHARPRRLRLPQRRRARAGQRLPPHRPGAQLRGQRARRLLPRLRGIPRGEDESGDTGEAPVLEQEGGGVQLMTVHKAKGLEFPVVILADLTAKLTGPQGGDRYLRSRRAGFARSGCCGALRGNCSMPPRRKRSADEEEALRVAYVAATRARDLLVVAAIGEEEREAAGSVRCTMRSIRRRIAGAFRPSAPGLSEIRRHDGAQPAGRSARGSFCQARPASPKAGNHPVVWFDPRVLALRVSRGRGRGE